MKQIIKDALWFTIGIVFVMTLIPPLLVIGAIAVICGPLDRSD